MGLLETAEGGTVFLDEVGEMPLALQAKLLRVLDQREVTRVGLDRGAAASTCASSPRRTAISASEIKRGRFRQDLYFRLNGITLAIPPLRERVEEIEPLAQSFVASAARQAQRARPPRLSPEALALLERYEWPGNVRELRNVIERAVLLCTGDAIRPEHLPGREDRPAARGAPDRAASGAAERCAARARRSRAGPHHGEVSAGGRGPGDAGAREHHAGARGVRREPDARGAHARDGARDAHRADGAVRDTEAAEEVTNVAEAAGVCATAAGICGPCAGIAGPLAGIVGPRAGVRGKVAGTCGSRAGVRATLAAISGASALFLGTLAGASRHSRHVGRDSRDMCRLDFTRVSDGNDEPSASSRATKERMSGRKEEGIRGCGGGRARLNGERGRVR